MTKQAKATQTLRTKRAQAQVVHAPLPHRTPRERFLFKVFGEYEHCREQIADFGRKFTSATTGQAAVYHMEWSDSVIRTAATAKVLEEVIMGFWNKECTDAPMTLGQINDYANVQVIRMATSPSRSTSVATNQIEIATLAAWAKVVECITRFES